MISKREFLAKYKIPAAKFGACGIKWNELGDIYSDYQVLRNQLESIASLFVDSLRHIPEVHSLKARTKDPEHLLEKIIRKRIADKKRKINSRNYRLEITDMIGVRALHLFKDDWLAIHKAITSMFDLYGPPVANIRKGDSNEMIKQFSENRWPVVEQEFGYRSIHYLVNSQPGKERYIVEIQVRTIFEEGWSEIDHRTRYPYDVENAILAQYLVLFNRIAGSADEMGSFVRTLKSELELKQAQHATTLAQKNKFIADLKSKIRRSPIQQSEKRNLVAGLDTLSKNQFLLPAFRGLSEEHQSALLAGAKQSAFQSSLFSLKAPNFLLRPANTELVTQPEFIRTIHVAPQRSESKRKPSDRVARSKKKRKGSARSRNGKKR